MIKALIFDFDGVLVFSEEPRFKALQQIALRYNITLENTDIQFARGKTTMDFLREILKTKEQSVIDQIFLEFKNEFVKNITEYIEPIPTTVEFIRNFEGTKLLGIASMSSHAKIENVIKHFGIFEKIAHIVGQDEVTHNKPDPEIYLKAATVLGVHPNECIVIEDTALGALAAINAKMECYIILNGFNKKEDFINMPIKGYIQSQRDLEKIR